MAFRAIPLQSAYCGAKHAINGFTESLLTELLHEGSSRPSAGPPAGAQHHPVRLVNTSCPTTPSRCPDLPARGGARAIVYAADAPAPQHLGRGADRSAPSSATGWARPLLDRYLARTGVSAQQSPPDTRPETGRQPVEPRRPATTARTATSTPGRTSAAPSSR